MMIKVNGEYLDFDGEITLEKQIKLFEDISTTDGDFSYAFDVQKTINNTRILQAPFPDNKTKLVYQRIPAEIISDDGLSIGKGYLRIERISNVYECSFFAGNNNWFSMITGNLKDLDFSQYDKDLNFTNITQSWNDTEGVKYPLVDAGTLSTRSANVFTLLDFIPFTFVHTTMDKIFQGAGIKIQGELLEDGNYKKLMFASAPLSEEAIEARSTNAKKDFQLPPGFVVQLTFPEDSPLPYFDGAQNNYDTSTSTYTADVRMMVDVEFTLNLDDAMLIAWYIRINGIQTTDGTLDGSGVFTEDRPVQVIMRNILLNAGDTLDIAGEAVLVSSNIISGNLKITPTVLYKTFSSQLMPTWTKQQFVSNVFKCFNVIASFDSGSKTLTLNKFESLKAKSSIDISEFVERDIEIDYEEFISDYATQNVMRYAEMPDDDTEAYNTANQLPYGAGALDSSVEFLEDTADIIESEFTAPFDYFNDAFDLPLMRMNFNSYEEGEEIDVTQVDDALGEAEFIVGNGHGFVVGDVVRITESTVVSYNGEHIVDQLVSTDKIHLHQIAYDGDANLVIKKLITKRNSTDAVFLAMDTGPMPSDMSFYTGKDQIFIASPGFINGTDEPSIAFFDMVNVGREINTKFIQGISFGPINDPLHYQRTLKDTYYKLVEAILNDPVKLKPVAYIPYSRFLAIDFLSPMFIKSVETSNEYYLNRITGYMGSERPCTMELIKI